MTSHSMTSHRRLVAAEGDVVYLSLQVDDASRARRFYSAVLGWEFGPAADDGHSVQVRGQSLPIGIWDGAPVQGVRRPGVLLVRRVTGIGAAVAAVRELGGTAEEPHQEPYGVVAECADDQGNGFALHEVAPGAPRPARGPGRPGDVVYLTLSPGDEVRAREFYGALFGWEFETGHVPRGLNVSGPLPMTGVWGGAGRQAVEPMFAVADIQAAVRAARALGGTATDPHREPYGVVAEFSDDQGLTFGLNQAAPPAG